MIPVSPWGNRHVDFGLNAQTGIYGIVFVDKNGNGIPAAADQFVKGVKITLDKKYKSITNSQGAYYFRNIADGTHTLLVDINSIPLSMIPLIKLENKIKVAEGSTYIFHVPLKLADKK